MADAFPCEAFLWFADLEAGENKGRRIGLHFLQPLGQKKRVVRLADQTAYRIGHSIDGHLRLRSHRAQHGVAGHLVVESDGRRIRRDPEGAPDQAVFQHQFVRVSGAEHARLEGAVIQQPVIADAALRGGRKIARNRRRGSGH